MRATDEAFLVLLRQEQGRLLRIARAITGQDQDAWDMLQEATLAAYGRFAELKGGPGAFAPWIRRILINRSRNLLRARSRLLLLEAPGDATPDPEPGPEHRLSQTLLWDEVMAMEDHHRQALALRFLVDMNIEEIATVLAVPPGTVKSRIHRALGALRRRLETDENSEVNCQ